MGDVRGAGVGVPAGVDEVEREVDDGLVLEQLPAEQPVPAVEARQVGADVEDLCTVEVGEVLVVAYCRGLLESQSGVAVSCKMRNVP